MPKATKALPDLRAAVDAAEGRRSHSAFDSWVKDDPKRAEEFWAHVDYARSRGMGWRLTVQIWNDNRPPVPLKFEQVRIRHEARTSGKRPA